MTYSDQGNVESLQTQLLTKFATIVRRAQDIHSGHLDALKSRVVATEDAFRAMDPGQDQNLFIEYNASAFSEPPDWSFEPCSSHYDTVIDTFLRVCFGRLRFDRT